uniref:Amino acid transporter transmembrane domain-containing protein n=1 Tax=Acrobeloides nanus TaxID=290746 RepID=A0A914C5L7_9BILA
MSRTGFDSPTSAPPPFQLELENTTHNSAIAPGSGGGISSENENLGLFGVRAKTENSISSEQAFVHMIKAMLGTGLLSLPLAFKHSGLYLGLILIVIICVVNIYCMRLVVFASHYVCSRNGKELIDYANIMRGAVEAGPSWIKNRGYFFKQLVNFNIFTAQLGFCCVYFVFMADNLEDFFNQNTGIKMSKAVWMLLLLVPLFAICSIRNLKGLAPFAVAANLIYLCAVAIVVYYFFGHLQPVDTVTKFGKWTDLPLFFGTVMFAFEGVSVIMPLENRMEHPQQFISWNGVLNSSCLVVLAIFAVTGFYGYLAFGDAVKDTVTLNLPNEPFYQALKIMFVLCIMVSYPLQFYVPLERVEKFITRKCDPVNHVRYSYLARYSIILITCAIAELVPHLALFIALVGAVACTSLAVVFPPIIDLLVCYAQNKLTLGIWLRNSVLFMFAIIGFTTGTYSALSDIIATFQ